MIESELVTVDFNLASYGTVSSYNEYGFSSQMGLEVVQTWNFFQEHRYLVRSL